MMALIENAAQLQKVLSTHSIKPSVFLVYAISKANLLRISWISETSYSLSGLLQAIS